jgi:hypothetical protein
MGTQKPHLLLQQQRVGAVRRMQAEQCHSSSSVSGVQTAQVLAEASGSAARQQTRHLLLLLLLLLQVSTVRLQQQLMQSRLGSSWPLDKTKAERRSSSRGGRKTALLLLLLQAGVAAALITQVLLLLAQGCSCRRQPLQCLTAAT